MLSGALFGPRVMVVEDGKKDEQQQTPADPCARELQNFVECARTTRDLRDCEGLNEALKACRKQFGLFLTITLTISWSKSSYNMMLK